MPPSWAYIRSTSVCFNLSSLGRSIPPSTCSPREASSGCQSLRNWACSWAPGAWVLTPPRIKTRSGASAAKAESPDRTSRPKENNLNFIGINGRKIAGREHRNHINTHAGHGNTRGWRCFYPSNLVTWQRYGQLKRKLYRPLRGIVAFPEGIRVTPDAYSAPAGRRRRPAPGSGPRDSIHSGAAGSCPCRPRH